MTPLPPACPLAGVPNYDNRRNVRLDSTKVLCDKVAEHLRVTLGWDINPISLNHAVVLRPVSRSDFRKTILQDERKLGSFPSFLLSRVQGVAYTNVDGIRQIQVVKETTRSWKQPYLEHELVRALTRAALDLHLDAQAKRHGPDARAYSDFLNRGSICPKNARQDMLCVATFHALHAQSVAQAVAPTTHTAPWRQRLWSFVLRPFFRFFAQVQHGTRRFASVFAEIAPYPERINAIYSNAGLPFVLLGRGRVVIYRVPEKQRGTYFDHATTLRGVNPRGDLVHVFIDTPEGELVVP